MELAGAKRHRREARRASERARASQPPLPLRLPYGLLRTTFAAGLLTSSCALTFCKPSVSASICFCCLCKSRLEIFALLFDFAVLFEKLVGPFGLKRVAHIRRHFPWLGE